MDEGIKPDLFWYNPNIHPFTEYQNRKESLERLAREAGLLLIRKDEYGLRAFIKATFPDIEEAGRKRCAICYRERLERTAAVALENGYDAFSTTLLISPYQDHETLKTIAALLMEQYGVQFLYRDYRPCFREGQRIAREKGFYMQKYCGCIFSEEERYSGVVSGRKNG